MEMQLCKTYKKNHIILFLGSVNVHSFIIFIRYVESTDE